MIRKMKLKIAIISSKSSQREEELFDKAQKENWMVERFAQNQMSAVKTYAPDLLITFDLAGFQNSTLADCVAYNLLDCKQLHFILNDKLPNERFLEKQLSISMFFYCAREGYYEHLKSTYAELPYLKLLKGWMEGTDGAAVIHNAALLAVAVEEVAKECGLA